MQIFKDVPDREYIYTLKEIPIAMESHNGDLTTAIFPNGQIDHICCLGCICPKCMYFNNNEISCGFQNFADDKSTNVCPVNAIKWDLTNNVPSIDSSKCIGCGICVTRCPVGALYFNEDGCLTVDNKSMRYIVKNEFNDMFREKHIEQIFQISSVPWTGSYLDISDCIFESIYAKLSESGPDVSNILVRNLLIALGCTCSMRRIGDNYMRMDAIYRSKEGHLGSVEIEFGKDTLEAARAELDDIATLHVRGKVNKRDNYPLVVCLQLPNARQGYWQLVKDVNVVENIKIETMSVGALMILLWNRSTFKPEDGRYYIDHDDMDLRKIICNQLNCEDISLSNRKLGILEPER